MLLNHGFDALLWIAAGGEQILVRFLHFVLVQVELGLRELQLVVERILLGNRGVRKRSAELRHALLVTVEKQL